MTKADMTAYSLGEQLCYRLGNHILERPEVTKVIQDTSFKRHTPNNELVDPAVIEAQTLVAECRRPQEPSDDSSTYIAESPYAQRHP